MLGGITRRNKYCGRVESDNVNTAHLLGDHDDETGKSGTADTRNCEEFNESSNISGTFENRELFGELAVYIVEVTSGLKFAIT